MESYRRGIANQPASALHTTAMPNTAAVMIFLICLFISIKRQNYSYFTKATSV